MNGPVIELTQCSEYDCIPLELDLSRIYQALDYHKRHFNEYNNVKIIANEKVVRYIHLLDSTISYVNHWNQNLDYEINNEIEDDVFFINNKTTDNYTLIYGFYFDNKFVDNTLNSIKILLLELNALLEEYKEILTEGDNNGK